MPMAYGFLATDLLATDETQMKHGWQVAVPFLCFIRVSSVACFSSLHQQSFVAAKQFRQRRARLLPENHACNPSAAA
jgi:hypothetical protein